MKKTTGILTLCLLATAFMGAFAAPAAGTEPPNTIEVVNCEEIIDDQTGTVGVVCETLIGVLDTANIDGENWHQFRQFQGQNCDLAGVCIEGQARMGFAEGCPDSGDVCLELTGKVAAAAPVEPGEIKGATLTHMDEFNCSWNIAGGCGGPFTDRGLPVHLHHHSMDPNRGWQCHALDATALGHITQGKPSIWGQTCYKYGPLEGIN